MQKIWHHPFLSRGFRPFFFLAALYTVIIIGKWGAYYSGIYSFNDEVSPVFWHAHEMIYGFVMAVVSGFLLTAVANWTGGAPARGQLLAFLCSIWIAGRIAMNVDFIPELIAIGIDFIYIPMLMVVLSIPLLKSWNKRNFVFLFMLFLLSILNLLSYIVEEDSIKFLYASVFIILAMISLIGGRIIPAFTVAALRKAGDVNLKQKDNPIYLDLMAIVSLFSLCLSFLLVGADCQITGYIAIISAAIHLWRMRNWYTFRSLGDPMLWILHVGYFWLVIGLLFFSSVAFIPEISISIAFHVLTVGAIGSMILGMITRVSLGHTGRELKANRTIHMAFWFIQLAVIIRVILPLFDMEHYGQFIAVSSVLWSLSYVVYLFSMTPFLFRGRPDGKPC